MIDKVRRVAELRNEFAQLDGLWRTAFWEWEKANAVLIGTRKEIEFELAKAESTLKAEALDQYRLDGNRKPCPGLEIKHFQVLDYLEEKIGRAHV